MTFGARRKPIPDNQSLILPILRATGDRKEHSVPELRQRIASELKLTNGELAERLESDSPSVFTNRTGWAVHFLKSAAAIRTVRPGVCQTTDRGGALLRIQPTEITVKTLRHFPEIIKFEGKGSESEQEANATAPPEEAKGTPEVSLGTSFQVLRDRLVHFSKRGLAETSVMACAREAVMAGTIDVWCGCGR